MNNVYCVIYDANSLTKLYSAMTAVDTEFASSDKLSVMNQIHKYALVTL